MHGHLQPLDMPPLTPSETKQLAYSVLTDAQKHRFEETLELDFSFGLKGLARFRGNCFNQRGAVGAVYRVIPFEIKTFQQLNLPHVISKLCDKPRGLILVTGPTGSGKSTTLAAMLDKINTERHDHIITIEDPIEFVHQNKSCLVNQREVHSDTQSFSNALRAALREDPDVVLIGEMRDLETIESALRIAETGHLTFGTLHTNSAASTINRIIDVFPSHQQSQIRAQLSLVLEGILCQTLLPRVGGQGRAMAMEILIPNAAVRNLIREDKIHQVYSSMQSGQDKFGMQTFNQSLATLYFQKAITLETALARSSMPDELQDMINRGVQAHESCCGHSAAQIKFFSPPPGLASEVGRQKGREEFTVMPVFTFTGTDPQGKKIAGERLADSKAAVTMQLRRERITPGAIKEKGKEFALPKLGTGKVPVKDIAVFFRQFSVMIDAGLPLVQCLEILAANQENQIFQKCLTGVRQSVEGGSTLSNAMRQYPKIFDDLTTNMIEAGEAGGILDTILQRLATYVEKAVKLKVGGEVGVDLSDFRYLALPRWLWDACSNLWCRSSPTCSSAWAWICRCRRRS